jgi:signal transduction histidine kinase
MKKLKLSSTYLLIGLLVISSISTSYSQQNYTLKKFTEADGLPAVQIKRIWLDNQGIAWIQTIEGNYSFDGNQFKNANNTTFSKPDTSSYYQGTKFSTKLGDKQISCTPSPSHEILIQKGNQRSIVTLSDNNQNTSKNLIAHRPYFFKNNEKLYLLAEEGLFRIIENLSGQFVAKEILNASFTQNAAFSLATISPDEKLILLTNNSGELIKFQKCDWLFPSNCLQQICKQNGKNLTAYTQLSLDSFIIQIDAAKGVKFTKHQPAANFTGYLLDDKKNMSTIHSIVEDKHSRVWLLGTTGLFISTKTEIEAAVLQNRSVYYWQLNKNTGLPFSSFSKQVIENSFYNPINGHLLFNNGKQSFEISTNELEAKSTAYAAMIASIYLDQKQLNSWPSKLNSFSSLDLTVFIPQADNYKNYQIEYRIKPGTDKWTTSRDHQIHINKLMPAEQTLEIRYNNSLSKQDFLYSRFPLYFKPSWYQSKWFRIGMILLGLSLIILIYFIREYRFRKANKLLNIKVEQKTLEIKRQMRKLKGLTQQNEMLIGVIAHDIKSPLRSISTLSSIIGANIDQTKPEELSMHLRDISKTSDKLSHFIGQFLTWYGQKNEKNAAKEPVNINSLINEIVSFVTETNVVKENKIETFLTDTPITIESNKQILSIIITNLLDNACKYTYNGTIQLTTLLQGRELIISCKDTGIGMDEETIEKLLNNETRFNPQTPESYKLGYVFINGLIQQINGKLSIESQPGKGSRISIHLKVR